MFQNSNATKFKWIRQMLTIFIIIYLTFSFLTMSTKISQKNKQYLAIENTISVRYSLSNMSSLKIVMPFHINQLDRVLETINKWNIFKPCYKNDFNESIEFIFYVGHFAAQKTSLDNLKSKLPQKIDCFSNIRLTVHEYKSADEDKHVKGSRLMFENMLSRYYEPFKNTSFVFYMEPDVRVIRPFWLNGIINEIGNGNFWSKGSVFRGDLNKFAKNGPYLPNYIHINGNALYNIGNDEFNLFYFNILRPYVVKKNGDSKNAYDTDFFEFLFDKDNYDITRKVLHKFQFTDMIQNYWQTEYRVNDLASKYPFTYFIHGGSPFY